jgi:DNA-binding transcriptional LysR family regulator
MDLDLAQLRALRAAVDAGTLDGAARALHVTPSAVSQRLKALEQATGRVLLVRSRPVVVTEPGRAVRRLAREVDLLAADAARELSPDAGDRVVLPVAVNADSLATWLLPALSGLGGAVLLDLRRADQDDTAALLRDGTVVAAVTAAARPVPGCTSTPLGVLRYRPAATPAFARRWFPDGPTAAAWPRPGRRLRPRRRPAARVAAAPHPRAGRAARATSCRRRRASCWRSWPVWGGGCSASCSSAAGAARRGRPARPRRRRRRRPALAAVEGRLARRSSGSPRSWSPAGPGGAPAGPTGTRACHGRP